jgi:hypothetical protein
MITYSNLGICDASFVLHYFAYGNAEIGRTRAQHEIPDVATSWILGLVEYQVVNNQDSDRTKSELIAQILCEFEEAGDAMRYLDRKGRVAWKATPRMLSRLADAEQEARDDLADW